MSPLASAAISSPMSAERSRRFWSRFNVTETGCWEWQGATHRRGYGHLNFQGSHYQTHRLAYALAVGDVPKNSYVLHSCDNPPCGNPAHLRLGDHAENMREAGGKGHLAHRVKEEYCRSGRHRMDDNPEFYFDKKRGLGMYRCRPCANETRRARYLRRTQA